MLRRSVIKKNKVPKGFEVVEERIEEFQRELREAEADNGVHIPKSQLLWPILRINHQRTRYIYQCYLKKLISREVYQYCLDKKYADAVLISKWKKTGYENLCCVQCIQTSATNFGTTCICRVPPNDMDTTQLFECKSCGCRGCSVGAPSSSTSTTSATDTSTNTDINTPYTSEAQENTTQTTHTVTNTDNTSDTQKKDKDLDSAPTKKEE